MLSESQFALAAAILFFTAGFITSFLPVLPGSFIAWCGIAVHKIWLGENSVSWLFFGIATLLVLLAQIVDLGFSWWGARKFGATWKGALGAVGGGLLGMIFFNLPGLILGPVFGAFAAEIMGGRKLRDAGKAGFGTVVGGLCAFLFKLSVTMILIAGFFLALPEG